MFIVLGGFSVCSGRLVFFSRWFIFIIRVCMVSFGLASLYLDDVRVLVIVVNRSIGKVFFKFYICYFKKDILK